MTMRPCKAADEGQAVEGNLGQENRAIHCARQQKQTHSREMDGTEGSSRHMKQQAEGKSFLLKGSYHHSCKATQSCAHMREVLR